jgi:hypothetical protein
MRTNTVTTVLVAVLLAGCGSQASSSGESVTSRITPSGPAASSASPTDAPKPTEPPEPSEVPNGDITKVEIIHRPQTLVLRFNMVDVSNLLQCSMGANDAFDIFVDADGDPKHEREIFLPWACDSVRVYNVIDDEGRRYCSRLPDPSVDTSENRFTLTIPMQCMPSAVSLRASAELWSNHKPKSFRSIPVDQTAWTPFAEAGARASVEDPAGDMP